jgi:hypothetical protein
MSRRRTTKAERVSPVLARLIEAAEQHGEDAEGRELAGAAHALREFGSLARRTVPIRGVFVANNTDVCVIVDRVAKQHLGLDDARAEFREALKVVEPFDQRDPIESAHGHVRAVSEEAYFYAGLAFGVTLTAIAT